MQHLPAAFFSGLCSAYQYLAERGVPTTLGDLDHHDCIGLNAESDAELWPFRAPGEQADRTRSIRVITRLSVNNQAAGIDAALRGQGIVCARSYQVVDHLAAGRLVRVLGDFETEAVPGHIIFPADRAKRGAVRKFIDHATTALKKELLWIEENLPTPVGSDGTQHDLQNASHGPAEIRLGSL